MSSQKLKLSPINRIRRGSVSSGVAGGGSGVAVGVDGTGVSVGGLSVGVAVSEADEVNPVGASDIEVAVGVGALHPIKNNTTNITVIADCTICWWLIFHFFRCGYEPSGPTY